MIPIMITARLGSTRLPNKHLLDLGGVPVIEHMVKRCRHFGFEPYICCAEEDVKTFGDVSSCLNIFGRTTDVETLLMECAAHYGLRIFHHIDGDDPFFCREAVIESLQCFRRAPLSRVLPSIYSQSGTGLVGTSYHLDAKEERIEALPDPAHMIWPQRLTLDYEEDYHLIQAVNRMVGYMAPRQAVDQLFEKNPDLHQINWFRNAEWKKRQDSERYSRKV